MKKLIRNFKEKIRFLLLRYTGVKIHDLFPSSLPYGTIVYKPKSIIGDRVSFYTYKVTSSSIYVFTHDFYKIVFTAELQPRSDVVGISRMLFDRDWINFREKDIGKKVFISKESMMKAIQKGSFEDG